MAVNLIKYPQQNPIQFVPENDPNFVTKYNFKHYNEWWMCERRKPWEGNRRYYQKQQQNDFLSLQFHSNNGAYDTVTLDIYTVDWELIDTLTAATIAISGFEIEDEETGIYYPANTHIVTQQIATLGLPDGFYIYVLNVPFDSGVGRMISEPIFLRDIHPHTMLLEYTNSENNFEAFYVNNLGYRPSLRVEAHIYNLTPQSDNTSYIDEAIDIVYLYDTPYNTFTFAVRRVPEWMLNKVNRVISHDIVKYDGIQYSKAKDAKLEASQNANDPLKFATISIQPSRNSFSQTIKLTTPIVVWQILNNGDSNSASPSVHLQRFPYFVRMATLNRSGGAPPILMMALLTGGPSPYPYSTDCLEVRNTSDETILLNHANNVTKAIYNQQGHYAMQVSSGGHAALVYFPAITETNYTSSNYVVLSQHFSMNFQNGAWGGGQYYDVMGDWIGYGAVLSTGAHASAGYGNGNPSLTYYVGGNSINLQGDTARVYHYRQNEGANTITQFVAKYSALTPNIVSVTGKLPPELNYFRITSGVYYEYFDWGLMVPCKQSIFAVELYGNKLKQVNFIAGNFYGQQLTVFSAYDVSDNALLGEVDNLFVEMYNSGGGNEVFVVNGGYMATDGQTPPAPPGGSSVTARNFISTTKGWGIITD